MGESMEAEASTSHKWWAIHDATDFGGSPTRRPSFSWRMRFFDGRAASRSGSGTSSGRGTYASRDPNSSRFKKSDGTFRTREDSGELFQDIIGFSESNRPVSGHPGRPLEFGLRKFSVVDE